MKSNWFFAFALSLAACSPQAPVEPIDLANPMVGTGFHGHTYPGATSPHGAVQLSPDTRANNWDACSGYHYSDSTLDGFSHTHLSGTGCNDLGDVFFRPLVSAPSADAKPLYTPAPFSHKDETASPGYYKVKLGDGIIAELTTTTRTGIHRYTYPADATPTVVIDMNHLIADERINEASVSVDGPNEVSGMRSTSGWTPDQYVYFVAQFSQDFASSELSPDGRAVVLTFPDASKPVVARVGISAVSCESAKANLMAETEVFGFDFDAAHASARKIWSEALVVITVEGGTREQLSNFYSALYHALIVPNVFNDVNGTIRRHDMSIDTLAPGETRYSTLSLWDTFRSWHPLVTLLDTQLVNDIVNSSLEMYDKTGEMPLWPLSAGETECMIGYHTASVIADAYVKGIRGYDAEKALDALVVSSNRNKKGSDLYTALGYIPSNNKRESVSCALEYAYDDWCIAQLAKALGKEDIYEEYSRRAQNFNNVFDGSTRFFRGKQADGNWETPFNIYEPGRSFTEATAWQYRFFAPQDIAGLEQLFGGRENFIGALDSLFTVSSELQGHQSDITGLVGQYAQGNEPSHNFAYLYNYVGQPWKTQEMTRRLLDEMYQPTPEGLCGNEDVGQMSAWYVLTALGIYPVCPGSGEYALTTPLFEKATIRLANGKELIIKANNPARNHYIKDVTLNGAPVEANFVTYAQLMEGGTLDFVLTDKPVTDRGSDPSWAPYSMTSEAVVSLPYVTNDLNLFAGTVNVEMGTPTDGASIYYTLDGSEPTEESTLYTAPFALDKDAVIKARAYKEGMTPSRVMTVQASKADELQALKIAPAGNGCDFRYFEGKFSRTSDMARLTPKKTGRLASPDISGALQPDYFGFEFSGYIDVPESGVYTFMTLSDDGSALYIDGKPVVDNDGSHGAVAATGRVALQKGFHSYRLLYFEDYEGEELRWGWKVPGTDKIVPVPDSVLFY